MTQDAPLNSDAPGNGPRGLEAEVAWMRAKLHQSLIASAVWAGPDHQQGPNHPLQRCHSAARPTAARVSLTQ